MTETQQREEIDSMDDNSTFDKRATARLLRKVDLRLIPFLALLYLMSFLDRSNIGNARLAGLEKDLNMHGLDYNVALAIFFPFYVLAEVPSNLMMKRFSPSIWIPTIMLAWGTMCCLMGIVKNYEGLLAARAALGLAEGGLFPGVTFYITQWYIRHECGLRMAIFFSAATAAGAFGGLLARAIMELDGARGISAWSWIFIIEGAVTVLLALVAFWAMYDYADTATFLTAREREEISRRLAADRLYLDDKFSLKYFWHAVADWKIYVHMLITFGIYSPLYSFSLFLPTIISKLGYSSGKAQLMTAPPYIVACFFCILVNWLSDKQKQRGLYMVACNCVAALGFIIQVTTENPKVRYLGTFFAASGIYPNVSQTVAWNGNNIGGSTKRAVGIAMQVGFGNLGGVLSGFTYTAKDAPFYHRGHVIVLVLLIMSTVLCCFMRLNYVLENRKRDKRDADTGRGDGWSREEMKALSDQGEKAGFFRYTL